LQIPDTFFTSLLSGRIQSLKDETGAYFIDRDPDIFALILNYLRTKDISDMQKCDLRALKLEAEFFVISPLVKRLMLIEEMDQSSCGDLLFYCLLPPPTNIPIEEFAALGNSSRYQQQQQQQPSTSAASEASSSSAIPTTSKHSRNSSWDMRVSSRNMSHSRNPSFDLRHHSRTSSADLNKFIKSEMSVAALLGHLGQNFIDPLRVQIIRAHHNFVSVAYSHFFLCYRMKDFSGWQLVFTSPFIELTIERIAINSKMTTISTANEQMPTRMVAISYGSEIKLWAIGDDGNYSDVIGVFNLNVKVEYLFFIGNQLVALSSSGKIGVWHSTTRHFQMQDLFNKILSFDYAGSFLLLGCANGCIYYIGENKSLIINYN
jgi:BTB/POZ domain-containing protein KCTD3